MSFFRSNGVGLAIGATQMAMAEAQRRGTGVEVGRCATEVIESGLLCPSPISPNITDPSQWRAHLQVLSGRFPAVRRIALSLPDTVVRILLLNLQQVPEGRGDFEALIRWHMEKTFLHPLGPARFSYQVLPHPRAGWKIVATAVRQEIITQYETLCEGHEVVHVTPVSFSLYNLFEAQIASHHAPNALFASLSERSLTVFIFEEGMLNFTRVKELPEEGEWGETLIREIGTSLSFYEGVASLRPTHLFLWSAQPDATLTARLEESLHLTPVLLDARRVIRMVAPEPMSAAVVAAAATAVAGAS
jgi:Tfp pilus assembly PilM family ATPase